MGVDDVIPHRKNAFLNGLMNHGNMAQIHQQAEIPMLLPDFPRIAGVKHRIENRLLRQSGRKASPARLFNQFQLLFAHRPE